MEVSLESETQADAGRPLNFNGMAVAKL